MKAPNKNLMKICKVNFFHKQKSIPVFNLDGLTKSPIAFMYSVKLADDPTAIGNWVSKFSLLQVKKADSFSVKENRPMYKSIKQNIFAKNKGHFTYLYLI